LAFSSIPNSSVAVNSQQSLISEIFESQESGLNRRYSSLSDFVQKHFHCFVKCLEEWHQKKYRFHGFYSNLGRFLMLNSNDRINIASCIKQYDPKFNNAFSFKFGQLNWDSNFINSNSSSSNFDSHIRPIFLSGFDCQSLPPPSPSFVDPSENFISSQTLDNNFRQSSLSDRSNSILNSISFSSSSIQPNLSSSPSNLLSENSYFHHDPIRFIPQRKLHSFCQSVFSTLSELLLSFGTDPDKELELSLKFFNLPMVFLNENSNKDKDSKFGKFQGRNKRKAVISEEISCQDQVTYRNGKRVNDLDEINYENKKIFKKVIDHVRSNQSGDAVKILESHVKGIAPIRNFNEIPYIRDLLVNLHPNQPLDSNSPDENYILDPGLVSEASRIRFISRSSESDPSFHDPNVMKVTDLTFTESETLNLILDSKRHSANCFSAWTNELICQVVKFSKDLLLPLFTKFLIKLRINELFPHFSSPPMI
jgi:hypothetical protein